MSKQRTSHVARLDYATSESGAVVTIEVQVMRPEWAYTGPTPAAADLPPEAADALRAWLANAPTAQETQS